MASDPEPTVGTARLRTGSLRGRVLVAVSLLLLAVIVAVCLIVNVILSRRLHDVARSQLIERARYAVTLSSRGLSTQDLADDLTGQGITASVVRNGTVVVGRDNQPPRGSGGQGGGGAPPGAGDGPGSGGQPGGGGNPPRSSGSPVAVDVEDTGQALRVTLRLQGADGQLRLVSSLAEIDRTLSLLHRIELGAGGGTLAISALLLLALVGAALSPLTRMREVADRIRHGARGVRLRPTRPGSDLGRTALAFDEMLESLEAAETQARAANDGMRRLLADVSHDLRTPIAGVLASAEQLLHRDPGRRAREEGLVDLIREGHRAARLVDDLLLMTRLDAGEPVPDEASAHGDADAVLASAVAALQRRRPGQQVQLDTVPVRVALDADRLTRIYANLLDNAGAAAGADGSVRVELRIDGPGEDATVVVDIADDGPGVPDGYGERIFDRLFRADPSRHAAGSGLGLPIARGLARAAGGEVRYVGPSAADGTGALFRVELPVASRRLVT